MTSPQPASTSSSTSTRDYLYRALYLRREMLILTAQNSSGSTTAAAAAEGDAPVGASAIDLHDILLLPPLYGLEGLTTTPPAPTSAATPSSSSSADPMLTLEHAWCGLAHIRGASSPWYRGCFAFYVYFPSRYPFEPPIIELTGPLRSHPLVQERRVLQLDHMTAEAPSELSSRVAAQSSAVTNTSTSASSAVGRRAFLPFEEAYAAVDPMRVSVMAVLLQHILRSFYPAEWPPAWEAAAANTAAARGAGQAAVVNRVLARRDVERRSVTQEVALGRPFEQYVGADVMEHFLEVWEASGAADVTGTADGDGADWYTREVLPHLLHS